MTFIRALFLLSMLSPAIHAAQIVTFFPTGSVKQVQQVTVRFSADMIAMGIREPKPIHFQSAVSRI